MSLLDHPDAQALPADAVPTPEPVRGCRDRLTDPRQRYLPCFDRLEQRAHATPVIRGPLSGLQRKACEPIAVQAGVHREPIRHFIGAGHRDDEAVMAERRHHVREGLADDRAILVLDPGGFPESGAESRGVARQWCGRLGEQDNCQLGVFPVYAAPGGDAPPDRRLYLPEDWADDPARREQCHVPAEVASRESWRIAVELLQRCRTDLPHARVTGDDELGRPARLRARLRRHGERYIRDVPCDTVVRDPGRRRPRRRRAGRGRQREVPSCRAATRAARQPAARRQRLTIRDGGRGPPRVDAMAVRVRTEEDRRVGPEERPVVMRTAEATPRIHYSLSNAGPEVPPAGLVRVRFERHRIEEVFEAAEGEAGPGHYEVRSWVGWHHHRTPSRLALWFLIPERRRVGGGDPGGDGVAGARGLQPVAAGAGAGPGADRGGGHARPAADGGGADRRVARGHGPIPAAPPRPRYKLNRGVTA